MIRRFFGGLAVAAIAGGGLLMISGPAATAAPTVKPPDCSASATLAINPGISLASGSQTIALTGKLSKCTGGTVKSGTATGKLTGSGNCSGGSASGTIVVKWNDGKSSTITVTITISTTPTVTAKVSKGLFIGDNVRASGSYKENGDCLVTPITSVTLTGSIDF